MIDGQLFTFAMFIGIVLSTFCGLFLGIEYGDGTIRNKVVVGHKRSSIYLANLITCIAAGLAMCAAFMLVYVAVGIPLIGTFTLEIKYILLYTYHVSYLPLFLCLQDNISRPGWILPKCMRDIRIPTIRES